MSADSLHDRPVHSGRLLLQERTQLVGASLGLEWLSLVPGFSCCEDGAGSGIEFTSTLNWCQDMFKWTSSLIRRDPAVDPG